MEEYAFAHPEALDMGTTISALLVSQQGAFVLNIGDSRTYKVVKNHLQQVTVDQNLLNDKHVGVHDKLRKSLSGLNLNEVTY
jgi:serine/threonine protein phosphatase PrpC